METSQIKKYSFASGSGSTVWTIIIVAAVCILGGLLFFSSVEEAKVTPIPLASLPKEETAESAEPAPPAEVSLDEIIGKWMRTDGQYSIVIKSVQPDGMLEAEYYNPRPINVSEAKVDRVEDAPRVFVKLQDAGYPGSTYTLILDPEKDRLIGTYFQATAKQTYQVAFIRANESSQ